MILNSLNYKLSVLKRTSNNTNTKLSLYIDENQPKSNHTNTWHGVVIRSNQLHDKNRSSEYKRPESIRKQS